MTNPEVAIIRRRFELIRKLGGLGPLIEAFETMSADEQQELKNAGLDQGFISRLLRDRKQTIRDRAITHLAVDFYMCFLIKKRPRPLWSNKNDVALFLKKHTKTLQRFQISLVDLIDEINSKPSAYPIREPASVGKALSSVAMTIMLAANSCPSWATHTESQAKTVNTNYSADIQKRLRRHYHPSRYAKNDSTATIEFTINETGQPTDFTVKDSRDADFGQKCIEIIQKTAPFRAAPKKIRVQSIFKSDELSVSIVQAD